MQMLPRRPRDRVVRLRPDQLVPELEPAVHLSQEPLLEQPGQRLARGRRCKTHDLIEGQVGEPPTQHGGEIERRPRCGIEPANLAIEHGSDGARDPDVGDGLSIQRLDVAQQRGRAVRHPLLRKELEGQGVAIPRLQDPARREIAHLDLGVGSHGQRRHQPLRRLRGQRLELEALQRPHRGVRNERARRRGGAELVGATREDQEQPRARQLAGHHMENRGAGVVGSVHVVHDQHERALVGGSLDRLEKRIREPQRDHLSRPLNRLWYAGKDTEDLRRHPRQLAQRLGIGAADRSLHRELLDQLGEDRERQLALSVVRLGTSHHGTFHLARRHEGVGERGLADSGIARHDHDPRRAAPDLEPRVVQPREVPLAPDQRL